MYGSIQDEAPYGSYPSLADRGPHDEVRRTQVFFRSPDIKIAEKPADHRLFPDPVVAHLFHHAAEPCAAAPPGTEDPDHVFRFYAVSPRTAFPRAQLGDLE